MTSFLPKQGHIDAESVISIAGDCFLLNVTFDCVFMNKDGEVSSNTFGTRDHLIPMIAEIMVPRSRGSQRPPFALAALPFSGRRPSTQRLASSPYAPQTSCFFSSSPSLFIPVSPPPVPLPIIVFALPMIKRVPSRPISFLMFDMPVLLLFAWW